MKGAGGAKGDDGGEEKLYCQVCAWVSNMFLCKMFVLEVFIFICHVSATRNGVKFLFHTGRKV